jgi:hypothetical protein
MLENGAKTVSFWSAWKPPHGCQILWRKRDELRNNFRLEMSWTRPKMKSLRRVVFFEITVPFDLVIRTSATELFAMLDKEVESVVDRIVHADSLKLLHRGPRSMRADAERFEAEQKLKGELCPA